MSEILLGVLNMPDDLFWSDDPITRMQHNSIRKEAAQRIAELEEAHIDAVNRGGALLLENENMQATIAELREFIDDILTFGQHPRPLDKVQAHMDKIEKWQAALLEKK